MLLTFGALAMARLLRPAPQTQNMFWIGVLVLAVTMPLLRLDTYYTPAYLHQALTRSLMAAHLGGAPASHAIIVNALGGVVIARWLEKLILLLFGVSALVAACRLAVAAIVAQRLMRGSQEMLLPADVIARLERFAAGCGMALPPMRRSLALPSPAVVGALQPIILLPLDFENIGPEEMFAALLHEYAHVMRRDFALTLICEIIAIPLFWHPMLHAIRAKIRISREQACDAIAAAEMHSTADYARCLVSLARSAAFPACPSGLVQSMFGGCDLEERVRKLLHRSPGSSLLDRNLRLMGGGLAMLATVVPVTLIHVSPLLAAAAAAPRAFVVARAKTPGRLAASFEFNRTFSFQRQQPVSIQIASETASLSITFAPRLGHHAKPIQAAVSPDALPRLQVHVQDSGAGDGEDADADVDETAQQIEIIQERDRAAEAERAQLEPDAQHRIDNLKLSLLQIRTPDQSSCVGFDAIAALPAFCIR